VGFRGNGGQGGIGVEVVAEVTQGVAATVGCGSGGSMAVWQ
jgi:hypothetical protein